LPAFQSTEPALHECKRLERRVTLRAAAARARRRDLGHCGERLPLEYGILRLVDILRARLVPP
jgi:hypothetical protein